MKFGKVREFFKKEEKENDYTDQKKKGDRSPFVDSDIDEAAVAFQIRRDWEKRRESRVVRELQWQLNREFLCGNQYCDINPVVRKVEEIPFNYDDEEREVFNLIAPKIEARLARLNRAKPTLVVVPSSDSQQDISTAKISTKIVRGTYKETNMQEHFRTANAWAELCSVAFHKDVWNPKLGRIVAQEEDEVFHEGKIMHLVVPAFEIYPESEFKESIEEQKSIIHAKPFKVSEIEELYDIQVPGRTVDVYNLENSRISTGGMGYTASIQRYVRGAMDESEVVLECSYLPCKKYPKGKLITVVGDRVVVYIDHPWLDHEGNPYHPFTKQVCIRDPGCFWGRTIIERMIPVQRRYNALKNRTHEFLNRTTLPAWEYESGSIVNIDDLMMTGIRAGDLIERQPGMQGLKPLAMPQVSYDAINEEVKLRELFTEISGVSEFSSQSFVKSGTPGIGVEQIKQQDDTRASLTSENIEFAAVSIGKKWLWLYKQFVETPRIMKVEGEDHTLPYVVDWFESDLTSFDVTLETEDLLTTSLSQKRQQVIFLLSQGLFHDPSTKQLLPEMRAKLFTMFDLGNWEDAVSLDKTHIRRAAEENLRFKQGMVPQVNSLDQHSLHLTEHTRFALTTEFEDLANENPMLREFLMEHMQVHRTAIAQEQQAIMQQQMMQQVQ